MQINPTSDILNEQHLRYFNFAGRFLGKALMDGQITPVHLVQPLYKHLMGWPVILKVRRERELRNYLFILCTYLSSCSLQDLEHIDDQVYRNLMELLDIDDVSSLYLGTDFLCEYRWRYTYFLVCKM